MILGSKPFNELTDAEIIAGVEELRVSREALMAESVRRSREKASKRDADTANGRPPAKPRAPRGATVDPKIAALLLDDDEE